MFTVILGDVVLDFEKKYRVPYMVGTKCEYKGGTETEESQSFVRSIGGNNHGSQWCVRSVWKKDNECSNECAWISNGV